MEKAGEMKKQLQNMLSHQLAEVGIKATIYESAPNRCNVIASYLEGADTSLDPGFVVHGHLDVVPANAADWSVDPFAAEIRDGMIWGRGAVDMKNMDAMILAVVRKWARDWITSHHVRYCSCILCR